MKIAVINGQNHKGSTYHIGKQVADKLDGEVTEFFLPRDFGDFCVGCTQCFLKSTLFALGTVKTDRGKIHKEMF